jgi:hypothetical protein
MDYKKFFDEFGHLEVTFESPCYEMVTTQEFTVEQFYQAILARLKSETEIFGDRITDK